MILGKSLATRIITAHDSEVSKLKDQALSPKVNESFDSHFSKTSWFGVF